MKHGSQVLEEVDRHFDVGDEDKTGQGDLTLLSIAVQYHF